MNTKANDIHKIAKNVNMVINLNVVKLTLYFTKHYTMKMYWGVKVFLHAF
jgi:hypothetical protein